MPGYPVKENREEKAKKIMAVMKNYLQKEIVDMTILDIGTGVGGIANYIADKGNMVYSVDVENQIQIHSSEQMFKFTKTDDEHLPFDDQTFDIAISNHVIEHVGNQDLHLSEINRVLKKGGVCYFATPNRYFIQDPHTRTLILHYLPAKAFFRLLKMIGKYEEPILLLGYQKMKKMFHTHGFEEQEYTINVINNPEQYHMGTARKVKIPKILRMISPTNIYVLQKK